MTFSDIEPLLYEDESTTLDFKREQYKFIGTTNEEKSELLKDILSFVNAWRRSDAFILIGVDETIEDKATVLGITDNIDDASLQQFVNTDLLTSRKLICQRFVEQLPFSTKIISLSLV